MRSYHFRTIPLLRLSLLLCCVGVITLATGDIPVPAAPILYADISPTAVPDEVLQLTGYRISDAEQVLYRAITDSIPERPVLQESESGMDEGYASVIARSVEPETLTVHWPASARNDQPYAIWVRNRLGIWSNALRVNEPQPLWFTPAVIAASAKADALPQRLQLIGRHLTAGGEARLRLTGPQTAILQPAVTEGSTQLDAYRRSFTLPELLRAGRYQVDYSADGQHWQPVPEQMLEVWPPSPAATVRRIDEAQFGACHADDGRDDRACLQRALLTSAQNGGTVYLASGQWDLYDSPANSDGLVVPAGVSLTGAVNGATKLLHHSSRAMPSRAMLSLAGRNRVDHLWLQQHSDSDSSSALLQLGTASLASSQNAVVVADIVLQENHFTNAQAGIIDSGQAIRNLTVIDNEFAIDGTALNLGGNRYRVEHRFGITDAVITGNIFHPSGNERGNPQQSPIASELGASLRMNFSGNQAVASIGGTPQQNSGWRAGFFWHLNDSQEQLLVSDNTVQCAGSGGDGEAFAFDNNGNTYAYQGMQPVAAADMQSVTVAALPLSIQNNRPVDVNTYYIGHWLQIVDGAGNGQSRRIVSYQIDKTRGMIRYFVTPQFSLAPAPNHSQILISRVFANLTVINNTVDNRRPACSRNNKSGPHGGAVSIWAQTQSAVIANNTQYASDGIVVQHTYSQSGRGCENCDNTTIRHVSLDISDNEIAEEYEWVSDCSQSGIQLRYGAAPTPDHPPPILGLNTRIAHNRITHADGLQGGAISVPLAWHAGPANFGGALIAGTIIEDNQINNINGTAARALCTQTAARIGINLPNANLIRGTVLHGNRCKQVTHPLLDRSQSTLRYCADKIPNSCECGT